MAALSAMSQAQRKATKKLAGEDDPRAVGFLSEALYSNDKELASASADALKRLLPRLQASDAALLNADQRAALRKAAQGKDAALALAVIGAWRQVGDEHDLAATRTIAQGEGRASLVAVLQPAAQETLPFLQQRVEAKRQSDTLLRAAEGYVSETAPDTLLRPAENAAGQTPPQQLLRPATGDDAP